MAQRAHIAVVDDHEEIRELLAQRLDQEGFRVTTLPDGTALHRTIDEGVPDLVVLDLMLPEESGLSLCRTLRDRHPNLPIVILTARGEEVDRIVGLELGADDYMAKPFSTRELVARIRAVLRRSGQVGSVPNRRASPAYRFEGWRLSTVQRELVGEDGTAIPLSTAEFNLLVTFCDHPHQILARETLLELTKGHASYVFDRSIDTQISRLRRKLGDDAKSPRLIKTIWGGGYVFAADVIQE